jgi:hypothetical protein
VEPDAYFVSKIPRGNKVYVGNFVKLKKCFNMALSSCAAVNTSIYKFFVFSKEFFCVQ